MTAVISKSVIIKERAGAGEEQSNALKPGTFEIVSACFLNDLLCA